MARRSDAPRRAEAPDPPLKPRRKLVRVEDGVRLSESRLWDLQRAFFAAQDPASWSRGRVPSYVTSNAFTARAAMRVVGGFLDDAAAGRLGPVDADEPITVLEIGAGSGRFAHGALRALEAQAGLASRAGLRVRYVITDLDDRPVEALRRNPRFRPFVERGLLDFAVLDVESPRPLALLERGGTLTGKNPLVAVANYVLDGIRTDAFEVRDGELFASLVRLRAPPGCDPGDPASLSRLAVSFHRAPLAASPLDDPALDALLHRVASGLPDGHFLFPGSAVRLLRHLRALGDGRLLFLAADRGHVHRDALLGLAAPQVVRHGSVSIDVNFHALAEHARATRGAALLPAHHPTHLATVGLLWGCAVPEASRTREAYERHLAAGGPEDVYLLKEALDRHAAMLDAERGLAWLRVSAWDPEVFLACAPAFLDEVDDADPTLRADLHDAAQRVRDAYFPIAGDPGIALALAELLFAVDALPAAAAVCEESLAVQGRDPRVLHRLATCLVGLARPAEARALLDEALSLAPRFGAARAMRTTLPDAPGRRTRG